MKHTYYRIVKEEFGLMDGSYDTVELEVLEEHTDRAKAEESFKDYEPDPYISYRLEKLVMDGDLVLEDDILDETGYLYEEYFIETDSTSVAFYTYKEAIEAWNKLVPTEKTELIRRVITSWGDCDDTEILDTADFTASLWSTRNELEDTKVALENANRQLDANDRTICEYIRKLAEAEAEIIRLKAKLYDYMTRT